jgi:hypothetical protein
MQRPTQPIEKCFSKPDAGGSKRPLPSGKPINSGGGLRPPPQVNGFPEERGRLDPKNSGLIKLLNGLGGPPEASYQSTASAFRSASQRSPHVAVSKEHPTCLAIVLPLSTARAMALPSRAWGWIGHESHPLMARVPKLPPRKTGGPANTTILRLAVGGGSELSSHESQDYGLRASGASPESTSLTTSSQRLRGHHGPLSN